MIRWVTYWGFFLSLMATMAHGNAVKGSQDPILSSYFVVPKDQTTMNRVADLFEVTSRRGKGYEVIVPASRVKELKALVPDAQELEADIHAIFNRLNADYLAGYHTFDTVQAHLKRIVAEHPEIASLVEYGKSKEGRPLLALKLSDNVGLDEAEPELLMTSATHGDELITVEVLMGILDSLVQGYGTNARLTNMVDGHELYFIPAVNPDGYFRKSRYANGVDPNREYPWPEMPERNPNECIKGIMDFVMGRDFKASIDYHASGKMVMYPWSYTSQPVDSIDQKIFAELTRKMAATNGYVHGQIPDVIYVAKGSSADFYYWKANMKAIAIEIGDSKVPPTSSIGFHLDKNLEAAYLFIESF